MSTFVRLLSLLALFGFYGCGGSTPVEDADAMEEPTELTEEEEAYERSLNTDGNN